MFSVSIVYVSKTKKLRNWQFSSKFFCVLHTVVTKTVIHQRFDFVHLLETCYYKNPVDFYAEVL